MNAYKTVLDQLEATHNLRMIPEEPAAQQRIVDLSTNDYLGLGTRVDLREEFIASLPAAAIPSFTSSASRLLASDQKEFHALENRLRELYGRDILLFNSGYHANTGAISSLADARTLIVADKLVHASIIDGATLSKAEMVRFRHNDMNHLRRILEKQGSSYDRLLIVTESVFSMDGDYAPIDELIALKRSFDNALLYVDEAHAFGVEGRQGLGLCVDRADVDFIVCTLGKAAASMGAFIATNSTGREFLVNKARSFIFSTALPPVNCAWSRFVIDRILTMDTERKTLKELGALLQKYTGAAVASHIQPLITGSSELAIEKSHLLLERGFKVLPIRTPTVPPGTERLRFSLSLDVKATDLIRLADEA